MAVYTAYTGGAASKSTVVEHGRHILILSYSYSLVNPLTPTVAIWVQL